MSNIASEPEVRSHVGTPTWEIAYLFPSQGNWSESEYLAIRTNQLVEFKDGLLEVLPMPTFAHQDLVQFLFKLLDAYVAKLRLGRVYVAPLRVRLRQDLVREPDLVYVTPRRITNPEGPAMGADLVMEVVSSGLESRSRDLELKRYEYAAAGIPEYWIIDPEMKSVTVLTLKSNSYHEHGVFDLSGIASSVLLDGFQVNVQELFAAADPNRA